MTLHQDNRRSQFERLDFANKFCTCVGIPDVFFGFYDSTAKTFTDTWCGGNGTFNDSADLIRGIAARVAVQVSLHTAPNRELSNGAGMMTDRLGLRGSDDCQIGIGDPIGRLYPVMAFRTDRTRDADGRQAIVRIGMAFVAQQLSQEAQARSLLSEGLLQTTLQILSVDFFVVTAHGRIRQDGRQKSCGGSGGLGWITVNDRLCLPLDHERAAFDAAVRTATGADKRTSIVSVSTDQDAKRLVVVTPLAKSDPALALILFERRALDHRTLREHFLNAYGLSRSEQLVAHEILAGRTVTEAAEATNLSLATVRSYMKQVFSKTGVHRQSELVSLYYSSILPLQINLS